MPTLGTHLSNELADTVETAAKASEEKKVGPWIAEAVRQRLEREGMLHGNPHAELIAAAEEVGGPTVALKILQGAKRSPRKHQKHARKFREAA